MELFEIILKSSGRALLVASVPRCCETYKQLSDPFATVRAERLRSSA
jgi:hypothetical protein